MSLHHVETFETADGKTGWRITVGDDVIANDARQGYNNRQDALHSLFGIWFGDWDESFLALYNEWQSYAGEGYEVPPEAQEGAPVRIPQADADAPNYASDPITASRSDAAARTPEVSVVNPPQDLGDDPDGDASVDPRDT